MNMTFQKRDLTWPPIRAVEEDGLLVARQNTPNAPVELKVLSYVGKINSNLMGTAMTQYVVRHECNTRCIANVKQSNITTSPYSTD